MFVLFDRVLLQYACRRIYQERRQYSDWFMVFIGMILAKEKFRLVRISKDKKSYTIKMPDDQIAGRFIGQIVEGLVHE